MWLGRHTPDEYLEFFEKLDDACNEMLALEANFAKLVPVANKWSTMSASAPPTDTRWQRRGRGLLNSRMDYDARRLRLPTGRASDFEIAVLAANRIDRKNEIDAVPAISPWIDLGAILSRSR